MRSTDEPQTRRFSQEVREISRKVSNLSVNAQKIPATLLAGILEVAEGSFPTELAFSHSAEGLLEAQNFLLKANVSLPIATAPKSKALV